MGEPEAADLVVWATGAVDLDLAVLRGDYWEDEGYAWYEGI